MDQPEPTTLARFISILTETPNRLQALQERFVDAELGRRPAPDQWSAIQILSHLRACQDVWAETIHQMLRSDRPELPYHHPREWAKTKGYTHLPFGQSMAAFSLARTDLLRVLAGLGSAQWLRSAVINNREHTVFSQVRRMALHEEGHWPQIEQL